MSARAWVGSGGGHTALWWRQERSACEHRKRSPAGVGLELSDDSALSRRRHGQIRSESWTEESEWCSAHIVHAQRKSRAVTLWCWGPSFTSNSVKPAVHLTRDCGGGEKAHTELPSSLTTQPQAAANSSPSSRHAHTRGRAPPDDGSAAEPRASAKPSSSLKKCACEPCTTARACGAPREAQYIRQN